MTPQTFGWVAVGLAAVGTGSVAVAKFTGAARDGFVRREVPAAVFVMPLLLFLYTFQSLRLSNVLLYGRLNDGNTDASLRSAADLIRAPMDAGQALRGPMIATCLLGGLAFFFATTPEERTANRGRGRFALALIVAVVGYVIEIGLIG